MRTENLQTLLKKSDAEEIAILDEKGAVIASISKLGNLIPRLPTRGHLLQLNNNQDFIALEPTNTEQLFARIAIKFENGQNKNILHVLYRLPSLINYLALTVEEGIAKYNELAYLRTKLKSKLYFNTRFGSSLWRNWIHLGSNISITHSNEANRRFNSRN